MRHRSVLLAAAVLIAAPVTAADAPRGPRYAPWGVRLSDMDGAVKPGDDFYAYVNGAWDKATSIPADKTYYGIDTVLGDEAEQRVRDIAVAEAAHPGDAAGARIGALWTAYMDTAAIERAGVAPLKPWLARIAAAKDRAALLRLAALPGLPSPASVFPGADKADAKRYAVYVGQGRVGLPSRDYYLMAGEKYDAIRAAYRAYVARVFTLAGLPDPATRAERMIAFETEVAKGQWAPADRRDVEKTNNPMTVAQLQALAPGIAWDALIRDSGFGAPGHVIVREKSAVTDLARLYAATPIATLQDWMAFGFVSNHAQYLPKAFDDAHFAFYGKTLRDQPEQQARWKRAVAMLNDTAGEAVGKLYVARWYPPESQRQMAELIANLRAAYGEELAHLSWMDDATRRDAQKKLAAFDPRTGYPVKWVDYTSLKVSRGDPLGNALAGEDFDWRLQVARFPKPVDRTLWHMTPQEVNAYYDSSNNQITFPAAILQPPFFDPAADPAVNYGGIGATIGHEMGHGFDDQGRKYAADGTVRDWWSKASAERYVARVGVLGKQFDGYEPIAGTHINGSLTMGENVGDLGGLEMAWGAWQRYKAAHGDPGTIGGVTSDQRFLIAYAYSWQGKLRDGRLRELLLTNPHSPNDYRVNGIVRNFDPWYAAFDVKPGDKLYLPPDQRVHIWVD